MNLIETNQNIIDLIFTAICVIFNLSVASLYICTKQDRMEIVDKIGIFIVSLTVPLLIVFYFFVVEGKSNRILLTYGLIFLYLAVEILLDFILNIPFRDMIGLHILYIIIFYIALFSMMVIAFDIGKVHGYFVTGSFWVLIGCLVYLYAF